jgi:hypothetical protein
MCSAALAIADDEIFLVSVTKAAAASSKRVGFTVLLRLAITS